MDAIGRFLSRRTGRSREGRPESRRTFRFGNEINPVRISKKEGNFPSFFDTVQFVVYSVFCNGIEKLNVEPLPSSDSLEITPSEMGQIHSLEEIPDDVREQLLAEDMEQFHEQREM